MDELSRIRQRIQESHPRVAPEAIRLAIGETEGRMARLENDIAALREAWWVESSRFGDHPRPGEEPFVDLRRERLALLYWWSGKAAFGIEVGLAAWFGWGGRILNLPPIMSAILCALLALAIAWITRGAVSARLGDDDRPLETRRRLKGAAAISFVLMLGSLLPLLLAFRGATDESLDLAIPASMVFLTLTLSVLGGCLAELSESYAQRIARAYHIAVHELERERLFRAELGRMLDHHPLARRNGAGSRSIASRMAGGLALLFLLFPALAGTETFRSGHAVIDTTGSLDRATLRATVEILAATLPSLVIALDLDAVEVSGWGATSTWAPPGATFPMPRPAAESPRIVQDNFLDRYFVSIAEARARKAAAARERAQVEAEGRRAELVRQACAEPAALLRGLAEAGQIPEFDCSPVDELLFRAALEPPTRLTIVVTDGAGCRRMTAVPQSSASRTVLILLPSRKARHGSVSATLVRLSAPWLTPVPASALDRDGAWIARLVAVARLGHTTERSTKGGDHMGGG